jgi:hypothetical protein
VLNNGFHFLRFDRCHRDSRREYPEQVYPFGSAEIELFAHESAGYWTVTEKKTGLSIAYGADLDAAQKEAHISIDKYGGPEKFIELIKDTLQKLNDGLEYDYQKKEWIDPVAVEIMAPDAPSGADE